MGGTPSGAVAREGAGVTHLEETRNFLGDPMNDFCEVCACSWFSMDDECLCECHCRDEIDYGDGDDV